MVRQPLCPLIHVESLSLRPLLVNVDVPVLCVAAALAITHSLLSSRAMRGKENHRHLARRDSHAGLAVSAPHLHRRSLRWARQWAEGLSVSVRLELLSIESSLFIRESLAVFGGDHHGHGSPPQKHSLRDFFRAIQRSHYPYIRGQFVSPLADLSLSPCMGIGPCFKVRPCFEGPDCLASKESAAILLSESRHLVLIHKRAALWTATTDWPVNTVDDSLWSSLSKKLLYLSRVLGRLSKYLSHDHSSSCASDAGSPCDRSLSAICFCACQHHLFERQQRQSSF